MNIVDNKNDICEKYTLIKKWSICEGDKIPYKYGFDVKINVNIITPVVGNPININIIFT